MLTTNGGLNKPFGLTTDSSGNIYVANFGSTAVYRVDPVSGAQTPVFAGSPLSEPFGIGIAQVPLPLAIASFGPGSSTNYQLTLNDATATSYSILQSTNLLTPLGNWNFFGHASELNAGLYVFTNLPVSRVGNSFFIIREP